MTSAEKADGSWVGEALELNSRWIVWKDFVYGIREDSERRNVRDFYFYQWPGFYFSEALAKK